MFIAQRLAFGLLLVAVAEGFRQRTRRSPARPDAETKTLIAKLQEEVKQQSAVQPQFILNPKDFPKCHLSESDCSMDKMLGATLVYTDSDNSRCWNGEPFAFLVHPGRSDKLLYYFPAGGACWEFPTFLPGAVPTCAPDMLTSLSATGYGSGISEHDNPDNFLKDYTFISPPYCGGGAHVANNTVKILGWEKYQHDYNNADFSHTWARQNLDQTLESFVIIGSSAGSLGAMAWSDHLLSTFKYRKASVVLDSYMGVFPEGSQGPVLRDWHVCNLPMWRNFQAECEAGTSVIEDIFDSTVQRHRKVAFAHIQPKEDFAQRAFYTAMALSYLDLDAYISADKFYETTNALMQRYGRHPNYVNYYIDGSFHTFAQTGLWYSATVKGATGIWGTDGKPKLFEWATALFDHRPVESQCSGWLMRNGGGPLVGRNYCDEKLYPKTLNVTPWEW